MTAFTVGGVDVGTTYGWYIDRIDGWYPSPSKRLTTAGILGKSGVTVTRKDTNAPRIVTLAGTMQHTTRAAHAAALYKIMGIADADDLTVAVDDGYLALQGVGNCTELRVTPLVPSTAPRASRLEATFSLDDPTLRETSDTVVTLAVAGTYYDTALGNAKSRPVIVLTNCTNPVITYRNVSSTTIYSLTLTITITSPDVVTIDMDTGKITKTVSSVTTNAIDTISAGTFPFALNPQDGVWATPTYPNIRTSSGTGTVTYRKRYL